jgi:hypothetical protein
MSADKQDAAKELSERPRTADYKAASVGPPPKRGFKMLKELARLN